MALTKSEARTRLRQRLRDTVAANYNFTDAILYTYMGDALREVGAKLREIDPEYFLTSAITNVYTDALDPGTTGGLRYEFYPLPSNCGRVRWIERHDTTDHYKIWESSPDLQEDYRYLGYFSPSSVTVDSTTVTVPGVRTYSRESAAVYKDRWRLIPPHTADDGRQYRVFYEPNIVVPDGDNELLPVPDGIFEKAVIDIARYLALRDDGDPLAQAAHEQAYGIAGTPDIGSLGTALRSQRGRGRKNYRVGAVV